VAPSIGGKQRDLWSQVAFYTSLGFIIPGSVVGGYIIGWFLDQHLHTKPVLGIIGGLAGAAGGIIEVFQLLTRMEKRADQDASSGDSGTS